jgi:hypothetical protein
MLKRWNINKSRGETITITWLIETRHLHAYNYGIDNNLNLMKKFVKSLWKMRMRFWVTLMYTKLQELNIICFESFVCLTLDK